MASFQLLDALQDSHLNTRLACRSVDPPKHSPCNFPGRLAPYFTSPAPLLRTDLPAISTCPF